jgi:hypothetical protein
MSDDTQNLIDALRRHKHHSSLFTQAADALTAAQAEAKSWRRVAERLEGEKVDAQAEAQEWRNRAQDKAKQWCEAMDERDAAQAEAREWRANHDAQVKRNALLRDRLDLPVERTKAYAYVEQLEAELARVREQIEQEAERSMMFACGPYKRLLATLSPTNQESNNG